MSTPSRADLKVARDGMRDIREVRRMPTLGFELREVPNGTGGMHVLCSGYASTTCADANDESNAYELEDAYGPWVESIIRGAFTKTIQEGADVAFLVNHEGVTMARTKARTLALSEDSTGLHYEARLNPTRPDVQILQAAVEDGAIDESSFAFRVMRQRWNEDYTRRWIQEASLHKGDVSPVNFGANDHTAGLLAIRNRLFSADPGRPEPGRRSSPARGRSGAVVLPDHTTRAKLDLARSSRKSAGAGSVHQMVVRDIRTGRLGDPVAVAKRALAAARLRAR